MLGLLLVLASVVGPQQAATGPANAEIVGTVFDRGGGVIPGVTVSLETAEGVAIHKVVTNLNGDYHLVAIAPGTYNATFRLSGFQTYTRQRLTLTAGQSHTLKVPLMSTTPAGTSLCPIPFSPFATEKSGLGCGHPSASFLSRSTQNALQSRRPTS